VRSNDLQSKIQFLGFVPPKDLTYLYRDAFLFVFPSTLEACPNTLIEGMSYGLPIATSKVGVMPEICQDAAMYFDPYNPEDIAEKIELIIKKQDLRKELRRKSLRRAQCFSWDKTAKQTLALFEEVYNRSHER